METIKKHWQTIMIVLAFIGWGITIGEGRAERKHHAAEVASLKEQLSEVKDQWKTQIEINQSNAVSFEHITTILDIVLED